MRAAWLYDMPKVQESLVAHSITGGGRPCVGSRQAKHRTVRVLLERRTALMVLGRGGDLSVITVYGT